MPGLGKYNWYNGAQFGRYDKLTIAQNFAVENVRKKLKIKDKPVKVSGDVSSELSDSGTITLEFPKGKKAEVEVSIGASVGGHHNEPNTLHCDSCSLV